MKARARSGAAIPQFLTVRDVQAKVPVSRVWIFQQYKAGLLKGHLVGRSPDAKKDAKGRLRGGRLLFAESDVLAWLGLNGNGGQS